MADEITVLAAISCLNGNFRLPQIGSEQLTFDQAAQGGGVPGTVEIGTSEEDVDVSALTTEGWLWMRNLDDTNYVDWGPSSGGTSPVMVAIGRMEAGESALFRLKPEVTLRMKANVAACVVQILVLED